MDGSIKGEGRKGGVEVEVELAGKRWGREEVLDSSFLFLS